MLTLFLQETSVWQLLQYWLRNRCLSFRLQKLTSFCISALVVSNTYIDLSETMVYLYFCLALQLVSPFGIKKGLSVRLSIQLFSQ